MRTTYVARPCMLYVTSAMCRRGRAGGTVKGSAGYVAIEHVEGTLHGRAGTFVLQHTGTMNGGTPSLRVSVVPDSGTGALTGLAGEFAITIAGATTAGTTAGTTTADVAATTTTASIPATAHVTDTTGATTTDAASVHATSGTPSAARTARR